MFLDRLEKNNPKLIDFGLKAVKNGTVLPDSYILDLDVFKENASYMKVEADKYGIKLFFMLKQIGRNPLIAKMLMEAGFSGAVCVDYKEALCMIDNGIKIGNVGHLEQVPLCCLDKIVLSRPEVITVYSLEKIEQINDACKRHNLRQGLMIRLTDDDSSLYSGQIAGFDSKELQNIIDKVNKLDNVYIKGLTVFPALLFDDKKGKIVPTSNINALNRGIEVCKNNSLDDLLVNIPSCTCCSSIPLIREIGGNNGEPGHGLSGTTPLHVISDEKERVAYCYVSEISHNFKDKAYCYGGGEYRRGHMHNILIGDDYNSAINSTVSNPDIDSIDYHFEIDGNFKVGEPCLMCFRTQVFTTRSNVVVVKGISEDKPEILGTFDGLGRKIGVNWHD